MNKDYYKYSEILFGLRNEVIANQKLLNELNGTIKVDGENVLSHKFRIVQLSRKCRIELILHLEILKRQKKILEYFNSYANNYEVSMTNAKEYGISLITKGAFSSAKNFDPKIEILNQDRLNDLADKIYNSKLMTIGSFFTRISQFQSLSIAHYISIDNWYDLINSSCTQSISYIPSRDTIAFQLGRYGSNYLAHNIFDSEIPRYKIPEEFQNIIDNNSSSEKKVCFLSEESVNRTKSEYEIKEMEKEIILIKVR